MDLGGQFEWIFQDSVKVLFTSDCGNSKNRVLRLPNVLKAGCSFAGLKNNSDKSEHETEQLSKPQVVPFDVKVFPNPSTSVFNLKVTSGVNDLISVKVLDFSGRYVKTLKLQPDQTVSLGSEFNPGTYFIQVKQGETVKVIRVLKF